MERIEKNCKKKWKELKIIVIRKNDKNWKELEKWKET